MEETTTKEDQVYATEYVENKQMAETTKEKLAIFFQEKNLSDWTNLGQEVKQKFYGFIREAYAQGNIYISEEEFIKEAKEKSTELIEETLVDYFRKYQKGIELLLLAL